LSIMIMPGIEGPSPGTSKDEWEYRHLLSSRTMIGLIILYCSFSFTRGLTSTFLPLFADQILHLSGKAIGTILTVNILLVGILQWPAGKLADMRGRVFLSSASLTAASITIFMIAWVNDFWQLCLIIIANSLCTSCAVPAMFAIAVDEGRKHGMAQAMSAMAMVQSIGFILGALTGGILMDAIGIQLLFAFGPVAGWIGVGIFLRLVRR